MTGHGVVLLTDDLMFGSKVESMIRAVGAEPMLVASPADAIGALAEPSAAMLIVDLVSDGFDGMAMPASADGKPVLGYYAHTDDDVRRAALDAGFTRVVPRSRMIREGDGLIAALLAV